jgi:hypothetical protein
MLPPYYRTSPPATITLPCRPERVKGHVAHLLPAIESIAPKVFDSRQSSGTDRTLCESATKTKA